MKNLLEKENKTNRRDFLKKAAVGVGGAILVPTILNSCAGSTDANSRLLIGHIGVGSRGATELMDYFLPLKTSYSAAVCDVWQGRRENAEKYVNNYYKEQRIKAPKCNSYLDFEEIIHRDDIDAVNIVTPDHWHLVAAIKAARAGKHVMLAKPLGLSYPHYKILEKELQANGVRFHYGTQQRSMRHLQLGINLIKAGVIGEISKVEVWGPGGNAGIQHKCEEVPVPKDFNYDMWTGPAPLNPFCPERVTKVSSRFQYDYCIGFLANWGAHILDVLVWALKEKVNGKYSCEGIGNMWPEGGIYNVFYSWNLNYKFESGLELSFLSNDRAFQGMIDYRKIKEDNGTTFYGSEGYISLSRFSAQSDILKIDQLLNDFPKNSKGEILSEENTMGQMFIDVINEKYDETCPLDEAIISDSISHMGDITLRRNKKITWDPNQGKIVDDPDANSLYSREMRPPYSV
jgi:hypothetical protein